MTEIRKLIKGRIAEIMSHLDIEKNHEYVSIPASTEILLHQTMSDLEWLSALLGEEGDQS